MATNKKKAPAKQGLRIRTSRQAARTESLEQVYVANERGVIDTPHGSFVQFGSPAWNEAIAKSEKIQSHVQLAQPYLSKSEIADRNKVLEEAFVRRHTPMIRPNEDRVGRATHYNEDQSNGNSAVETQSGLRSRVKTLQNILGSLQDNVDRLANRISPVLVERSHDQPSSLSALPPAMSPIDADLRGLGEGMIGLATRLDMIINGVDL